MLLTAPLARAAASRMAVRASVAASAAAAPAPAPTRTLATGAKAKLAKQSKKAAAGAEPPVANAWYLNIVDQPRRTERGATSTSAEENAAIAAAYNKNTRRRHNQLGALLQTRNDLRTEAIQALPTEALRAAARVTDEELYPLNVPMLSWTPPIPKFDPAKYGDWVAFPSEEVVARQRERLKQLRAARKARAGRKV